MVFPGADGSFTLYEDDGTTTDYEQGASSTIYFDWEQQRQRLTIGKRVGNFDGMSKRRTFKVLMVEENSNIKYVKDLQYTGKPIMTRFK